MRKSAVVLAVCCLWAPTASAGTKVLKNERMDYASCLAQISNVATKLGVAPVNIVETDSLRMVRFMTNDGSGQSVLITCTRVGGDERMVMNLSW